MLTVTTWTPRLAAILLTAVALAGLVGCAADGGTGPAPSGGDTQTTSQACETVRASVQDAAAQVQRLDPGDPSSAVTAFDEVAARLDDAAQAVGNRSVADLLPPLRSGFTTASADLSAIAGGDLSRLASLQSAAAQIQSALSAFAAACPTP
ncbi:hypothetical protein HMPREF1529_00367 [Microbacterium sp. oral taxon 186 str. F0373]|uniref:Lipoprotein n=1 Tax=Microbacterium laevaniformans TaxID=36807 RepID=A0A150H4U2_9MICO|nr:hypothetical protein HMPREF1529_00367 [Microbacterium sp. oral taxon 186 str. F0373]KXZ57139.1 hypothetical protein Mlaev_02899 [Microbacterium laevaniformans]